MTIGKKNHRSEFIAKHADTPLEVAIYYGFRPIDPPTITKDDLAKTKNLEPADEDSVKNPSRSYPPTEEQVALTRTYLEKNLTSEPQPLLLYSRGPLPRERQKLKKGASEVACILEIFGTTKSVAEALLIDTSITILKEEGYKNLFVEINNLGGRESASRFQRELVNYFRKHINELPAVCRQAMKKNIWPLLNCTHEKCKELSANAPRAVSFLNEAERSHFKEILEFLETFDLPYQISNHLIGNRTTATGTIFEVRHQKESAESESTVLACGSRHDDIAKKIGGKKEIPSASVVLTYQKIIKNKKHDDHQVKKPKVYFIQLGFEAKLKSLKIIEILRQNKIPVYQSLSRDKIGSQLIIAEKMRIPFIMIVGQKEALENSVIVRNMENRSQDTISVSDLPKYLKRLRD